MDIATADIYDANMDTATLLNLPLLHFGKKTAFAGQVVTLKLHEDNTLVRTVFSERGKGKVLVIDGGGSLRCALIGDNIAKLAIENEWEGAIVYGCIRDSKIINQMNFGIKALGTCPIKSVKRNVGLIGEKLIIEGTTISQGNFIYVDEDGILLANQQLKW